MQPLLAWYLFGVVVLGGVNSEVPLMWSALTTRRRTATCCVYVADVLAFYWCRVYFCVILEV